jgi:competence protein ComEC
LLAAMNWRWLLGFSAGVVLSALVPALPPAWLILAASALAVALWARPSTRCLSLFFLGALWFLGHAHWQIQGQWPEARAGEVVEIPVKVVSLPEWRGDSIRFLAEPLERDGRWPRRIQARWYRPGGYIQAGQVWQLRLRVLPPRGRANAVGFDYTRFLLSQRIAAIATVRDGQRLRAAEGLAGQINRARQYLGEVITAETRSLQAASLMRALSIADRSMIDEATRERLAVTGTAHLLAISGLHIGMVAVLAGAVGSVLALPLMLVFPGLDRKRFSLGVGLLSALAYALLAGLTLPTQRALIMLCVVGLALAVRRGIQPAHALLVAFAAVLVVDPLAVLSTGFWMSFAAVAVLIWTFAWRPAGGRGLGTWLVGLLRAQMAIGVGLLAVNAGLFSQVYWAGFPANLVAIPLVGFWVLPSLLAGLLLIALDLPAAPVLALAEGGLNLLMRYLEWLETRGPEPLLRPPLSLFVMLLGVLGSFWLLAPPGWPARWLGLGLLAPVLWPASLPAPAPDQLALDVFDVGQGQAVLIRTRDDWTLYDTGPGDGAGQDVISQILPPVLAAYGRRGLDRVIVSSDHGSARGGLGSVLARVPEEGLLTPIDGLGRRCIAGEGWQVGAIEFRFLHPGASLPDLGGNSSCVLFVRGPGLAVLLTGRIDADVERRLLALEPDLDLDVLVLSGGGHRRASSAPFLDAITPSLALASVEPFDRFDRPHREVIERLESRGIRWLSTAACGAMTLRTDSAGHWRLTTARGQSRRFWQADPDCP